MPFVKMCKVEIANKIAIILWEKVKMWISRVQHVMEIDDDRLSSEFHRFFYFLDILLAISDGYG